MLRQSRILTLISLLIILLSSSLQIIFLPIKAQDQQSTISYPFQADNNSIKSNSKSNLLLTPLIAQIPLDQNELYYSQTLATTEEELKIDDGTVESGVVDNGLIVVNRLTPSNYPAKLQRIRIRFDQFQNLPNPIGQQVQLLAFADSSGSGQPSNNPTLLINQQVTISQTSSFIDFTVTNLTINAGDLYIGYQVANPANGVGFSLDSNGPQRQRSFMSLNNGSSYSLLRFSDNSTANTMVRAVVAYEDIVGTEEELKTDDGTIDGRGIVQDNLVMVNRLTPTSYPAKLKTIRIFFATFQNRPSPVGQTIRLVAFTDPNSLGRPSTNPVFLVNKFVTVTEVNKFIDFAVDGPTLTSGDIYVGYQAPNPAGGIGFAADTNGFQQERGFFSNDGGSTFSGPVIFSDNTKMNLMIRAIVSKSGASGTPDFALSLSPNSQTVVAGNSTSFNVNLQAINGFNSTVSLSAMVSPNNNAATISMSTSLLNPGGNATLTFNTFSNTPRTTYTITITGSGATLTRTAMATVNVIDATNLPTVTIENIITDLGESSSSTPAVLFKRSGNTTNNLMINYNVGGTATSGNDYQSLPGTILIPTGASQVTLNITPLEDSLSEGNETIVISLANSSSYQIGSPSNATINIIDNESLPTITIDRSAENISEMSVAEYTVNSNIPLNQAITVYYQVSGNATLDEDYAKLPGTIVIPKGASSASIALVTFLDTKAEGNEIVTITLGAGSSYIIGTKSFTSINITDSTKSNGTMINSQEGGVIVGDEGSMLAIAPTNQSTNISASITKIKSVPKKLKVKNDTAVVSATYTLTLSGNASPDRLMVGIPISEPLLAAGGNKVMLQPEYLPKGTKTWLPIGDKIFFDSASKQVYFRVESPKPIIDTDIAPLADTTSLAGKYRVVNRLLRGTYVSENPNSKFKISYYAPGIADLQVPSNSSWGSCSGNTHKDIPNYVLDLDKYLNEIYDSILNIPDKPFSALSTPQEVIITRCGSNGTEAGESPLGGPMRVSNWKISDCNDMKRVAAHELVHVFQGQYYTNGKLGYVLSSIIGNNWFVDAVANYYTIKALNMNDSEIKTFLESDGGIQDYLSVGLTTDSDNNRYAVAHFLLWLEKEYGKDIVTEVLKAGNSWDLNTLSEKIRMAGAKDGIETAFNKYGFYLQTHPEDYNKLNENILFKMFGNVYALSSNLSSPTFSDKVHYVRLEKAMDPLSIVYFELRGRNTSDAMLVIDFSGSSNGLLRSQTYDFVSSSNQEFAGKKPLETSEFIGVQKPFTIKHFGQGKGIEAFNQMITYSSKYIYNNTVKASYYLLVPPVIKAVEGGKVTWTFEGVGTSKDQIPNGLIAGFNVYSPLGVKLNSTPISAGTTSKEATYNDMRISAGDKLTITIVDIYGNSWPEVKPISSPIKDLKTVTVNADLFFKAKEVQKGDQKVVIPEFHLQAAFSLNPSNASFSDNSIVAYGITNGYGNELLEFRLNYDVASLTVTDITIKSLHKSCSNCSPINLLSITSTGSFTAKLYTDSITLCGAYSIGAVDSNFKVDFDHVEQDVQYTNADLLNTLPGYSYNTNIYISGRTK